MPIERAIAGLIAMILFAAAFVAVRRAQRRIGTPVDVLCIFLATWAGTLLLFAVPVIDYSPMRLEAWLLIYGSIAATGAGCLLAWWRWGSRPAAIDEQQRALQATIDPKRLRRLWLVSALLGLAGFAAFVYAVDRVAGWQAVFSDPAAVRTLKRDSLEFRHAYGFWTLLTYFNQVAFIVWTVGIRMRAFTGRWRVAALLGFASLIPFVFTADRNLMAAALALACTLHLLWGWRASWRRVALVLGVGLAGAAVALTAIGNRYGGSVEDHPEVAAHLTTPALEAVAIPYLYLTANLPTFGALTQDGLAPRTAGQMTVLPAVKAAARAGLIDTAPVETGVFYPIPFETFSNYSWLGSFWLDFRVPGVLLLPLLVGFAATTARLRLVARPTFLGLWTAAILLYVVVYSPLANVLSTSLTWEYMLLGPVMAVVLDPTMSRRALARLRASPKLAGAAGTAALAVAAGLLLVATSSTRAPRTIVGATALRDALAKARYVYGREGRYPIPLGLATRLGVNRPDVPFRPQTTYTEPLPGAGIVAVYTQPNDVFLRVEAGDGRVYEVHRTEEDGGITYGPGTRDR